MDRSYLIEVARRARGLTQVELAKGAGTSQATLSAYERGVKSPTLKVAQRIIEAAGHDLSLAIHVDWTEHHPQGIVPFWAPSILWGVETPTCFATLELPNLIQVGGKSTWNLRDREERIGAYTQLIRRGLPEQMIRWIDGGLLVDVWEELDLPDPVREAWFWPIRLAQEPLEIDALSYFYDEDRYRTSRASIHKWTPLPPPPPRPKPKPRRSRFDPRPPPTD